MRIFREELESIPSIRFENEDFVAIMTHYRKPNTDMIYYPEFCDDLENYGSQKEEKVDPHTQFNKEWDEMKETLAQESVKTNEALQMLKGALMSRRLAIDDMFFNFDFHNTGMVPIDAAESAFRHISSFLTKQQMNQIMKEFRDKRQPEKFNYRKLCKQICRRKSLFRVSF